MHKKLLLLPFMKSIPKMLTKEVENDYEKAI